MIINADILGKLFTPTAWLHGILVERQSLAGDALDLQLTGDHLCG